MTSDEMIRQFNRQMEERPEVMIDYCAWYFDAILPTLPADCLRFSDCDDWAEAETVAYPYNPN